MRRILSVLAAVVAVALVSAALAASTFAGSTTRVSGTVPLTYAAEVTGGAVYNVSATGYVMTAKVPYFHVPGVSKSASGPAGQPNEPCLADYENDVTGHCTVLGANFGELVGVIVNDDAVTVGTVDIGASPMFTAPVTGHLLLAANDLNLTYWDNNGQFDVVITPQ